MGYFLFGSTHLPVEVEPKLKPTSKPYPIMLFSHGLAGSRRMYSVFCGEMASRGYIVAAIESRDGSGPATTVVSQDGTKRVVEWLRAEEMTWPDGVEGSSMDLRRVQLQVRTAEIQAAVQTTRQLANGDALKTTSAYDFQAWKHQVDAKNLIMAGHSFGGGSTIAACRDLGSVFKQAVALDPWLERRPSLLKV